jgi:hypothetical protein
VTALAPKTYSCSVNISDNISRQILPAVTSKNIVRNTTATENF